MRVLEQPKSDLLRRLYWRDEILQLLFWIEGEGLGSEIDLETVDRFLGPEGEIAALYLDGLVEDGYLERSAPHAYRLSTTGRAEGRRLFAEEFAQTSRPAHGACGSDCWCRQAREEAEACLARREAGFP